MKKRRDPVSWVKNWTIKMRVPDFLKTEFQEIHKRVSWECPVCFGAHGSKKCAQACMESCRTKMLEEWDRAVERNRAESETCS